MENLGMCIRIQFSATGLFGASTATLHNVTEIHYNYPEVATYPQGRQRVAFESDIHGTGFTYAIKDIEEFEATIETVLAEHI